jgi:hypothetical protein
VRRRWIAALVSLFTVAVVGASVGTASPAAANNYEGHHWAHNGLSHSQIYFVDHTGSYWPVNTVTYKWNLAQGVDSYYEWASCPSSSLHCVNVYEYSANDGNYGITYWPNLWDSAGHNYEGQYITLNDYTVTDSTQARKTTCQEEGHVLGLDHQYVTSSCMMQGPALSLGISPYPNQHDFDELFAIYNHAN